MRMRIGETGMLRVCGSDLKKLYQEIEKGSIGSGWKTQLPHVDWRNLRERLQNRPAKALFPVEDIAGAAGLPDALWSLGAVRGYRRAMRLFACRCAGAALRMLAARCPETVLQLHKALDTGERHARGQATDEELATARVFVWGLLNPDKDVRTDENGAILSYKGMDMTTMLQCDLGLRSAMLATAAALREDAGGGVWRAAQFAGGVARHEARETLRANAGARQAALKAVAGPLAEGSRDALELLSAQALTALAGKVGRLPSLEELREGVMESVRRAVGGHGAVCERRFVNEVVDIVKKAPDATFAEFLRLCRLQGEYGELGEE